MEPRLKWNKIILAAKLFHFRRGSVLKQNTKILKNNLLANVNSFSRSLYAVSCPLVCLSVVCLPVCR